MIMYSFKKKLWACDMHPGNRIGTRSFITFVKHLREHVKRRDFNR